MIGGGYLCSMGRGGVEYGGKNFGKYGVGVYAFEGNELGAFRSMHSTVYISNIPVDCSTVSPLRYCLET